MRNTSLLKTIPKAFYSQDIYREVGREWSGMGFGYLLLLISVLSLPVVIASILYSFTITLDKPFDANYLINQIPEITITKGELSVKVPEPYYITEKETNKSVVVIDTTRPVTDWSQQMSEGQLFAAVGKNQALVKENNQGNNHQSGKKTLYDIPKDMTTIVTSDTARDWAEKFINYIWLMIVIAAPFVALAVFLFRIVTMFFYGIFTKIISLALRTKLSYTDCVRLASVATTPTLILSVLIMMLQLNLSGWTYFIVNIVYLFYAVKANKT